MASRLWNLELGTYCSGTNLSSCSFQELSLSSQKLLPGQKPLQSRDGYALSGLSFMPIMIPVHDLPLKMRHLIQTSTLCQNLLVLLPCLYPLLDQAGSFQRFSRYFFAHSFIILRVEEYIIEEGTGCNPFYEFLNYLAE